VASTELWPILKAARLRNVVYLRLFIAAGIVLLATIGFSRAATQHATTPQSTPSCPPPCSMPVGLAENFDNVSTPALPPDWLATNALGSPPLWLTSNSGVPLPAADTSPNAASIDDPAIVSDKRLDSLAFPIPPAHPLQLTFRQNFNLEASDVDPNLGFDGGALEVSFNGGNTFQDILDAGGSFAMGGYNRTISTDRGSPIAGRQAWSGNSQGFLTTVVNLPVLSTGARLRWRMASDTSGSGEGWRIDTINVAGCAPVPCQTPSPLPRPTPFPRPVPTSTVTPHGTPKITPLPRPSPP
jgi:hypothetical protein